MLLNMLESVVYMRKHMSADELIKYAENLTAEIQKFERRYKAEPSDKVNYEQARHFRKLRAKVISVLEQKGVFRDWEVAV